MGRFCSDKVSTQLYNALAPLFNVDVEEHDTGSCAKLPKERLTVDGFFNYAKSREKVRIRKERDSDPATWYDPDEKVMTDIRLTNVFQQDDAVSKAVHTCMRPLCEKYQQYIDAEMNEQYTYQLSQCVYGRNLEPPSF